MARIGAVIILLDRIEEISIISAIRFRDGGAAILPDLAINHNIVIIGKKDNIPLVK